MSEAESKNQFTQSSYQMIADPTFINLKLNTSELLQRTEIFLAAKKIKILRGENGELYEKEFSTGRPYANEEGVAAIMSMIDLRANNHSVQGNMNREEFYDFLADTRKELTEAIILNCYEWEVHDSKLNVIIDTVMGFIRAFLSRTIDNKERESLMAQFNSREVITQKDKEGVLQRFSGGIK